MESDQGRVCFAWDNGRCAVLRVMRCEGCRFFKTKKQLEAEQQRSEARQKKLGIKVYNFFEK